MTENTPGEGHNSRDISAEHLESFVKRIERLKEERAAGAGFDTKIMREVIKLRAMDPSDVAERKALIDVYLEALGQPLPLRA